MAHTPGPWHPYFYVRNQRLKLGEWGCISSDSHPIPLRDVKPNDVVASANARLIAAAPELLAACREAVSAITYLLSNDDDGPNYADTLNTLAAAISKAEGMGE